MTSKKKDASFNAAAEGKLKVLGMSVYAQWITKLRNAYKAFMITELEQRENPSDSIHPNRLVAQIMATFGEDAYYVADGGDTSYYGLAGFASSNPAGVLVPAGALPGCLGTGIPFAMTGKLSHPDKPVIVLNGGRVFRVQQHGIRYRGAAL